METMLDLRELSADDVVRVAYPARLASLVREAKEKADAFWELPQEVKEAFGYQSDTLVSGVGYQGPEDGSKDPKEHVHLRLNESAWLRAQCAKVNDPAVSEFVETGLALAEGLKPFAQEFVESAESEFSIPGLAKDTMSLADGWTFRFLRYQAGKRAPGEDIAAQHLDKGGFTLHLHESDSGFERLTRDGTWVPVAFGDGHTLIIAGARLQYRSRCRLTAVCHKVVANERTAVEGRTSIVCFFDFRNTPYYDKSKWGPMQGLPVGFNYDLPFVKYAQYFTEHV